MGEFLNSEPMEFWFHISQTQEHPQAQGGKETPGGQQRLAQNQFLVILDAAVVCSQDSDYALWLSSTASTQAWGQMLRPCTRSRLSDSKM